MREEIRVMAMLAALPLVGMGGFMVIERWNAFDSLYMAVITLTTVGYSEVHSLSAAGRVFVMVYLVAGLGVFLFGMVRLGEMAVRTGIGLWTEERRMSGRIESISHHFIVCGCGRMGRTRCQELAGKRLPFVVVERSQEAAELCRHKGWPLVVGDATDDGALAEAGIATCGPMPISSNGPSTTSSQSSASWNTARDSAVRCTNRRCTNRRCTVRRCSAGC